MNRMVPPGLILLMLLALSTCAQAQEPGERIRGIRFGPPVPMQQPGPTSEDRPLPINLATALSLAGVRPLDIALATEQIKIAAAQLERSQVLWLPSLYLGMDYFRHDGQLQDVAGKVF